VVVIEEAIQVLALPQDSHVDACAKCRGNPLQQLNRKLRSPSALDPRSGLG